VLIILKQPLTAERPRARQPSILQGSTLGTTTSTVAKLLLASGPRTPRLPSSGLHVGRPRRAEPPAPATTIALYRCHQDKTAPHSLTKAALPEGASLLLLSGFLHFSVPSSFLISFPFFAFPTLISGNCGQMRSFSYGGAVSEIYVASPTAAPWSEKMIVGSLAT